jgi:thiamine kinase-like enzyme
MELTEIKSVFENFEKIAPDFQIKTLESGYINHSFWVHNNSNTVLLQKVNSHVFPNMKSISSNILEITNHLKSKDYPHEILHPLSFSNGKYLWKNEWRIFKFIDNSQGFDKVNSSEQCLKAAKFLGEFHLYLSDLDSTKIQHPLSQFLDYENRWQEFVMSVDFAFQDRYTLALPEINFVYENRNILDRWINIQSKLPIRIIHADPKISNFLFEAEKSNKIIALIDWDTFMPGTILYDFGDMVRSYTNLKKEDEISKGKYFSSENYNALKEGFLFHLKQQLNAIEIENLPLAAQSIIFIQAIRFLTDFLNNDQYYHTSYNNQNLHRTQNQIQLLKELRAFLND